MCKSLKNILNNKGYSLVEFSIVIIIVGVLIGSGASAYQLYKKHKIQQKTELALLEANLAIAEYKKIYGRYPCPARIDAALGDTDYGYEHRSPAGSGACQGTIDGSDGVWVTASNNAVLAGPPISNADVFIGSLPFRQMNLSEDLIHDGYGNRITYAVTGVLTSDQTYSNANGGIGVIGLDDTSLTETPDTTHFVIISHNENDTGAISRAGVQIGGCPSGNLEEENCNFDATFRIGQLQADFDDLLEYSTSDTIEQWQISNSSVQNIHLRGTRSNVALGVQETDPTTPLQNLDINEELTGDAVIMAEADPINSFSGSFIAADLCDEDGTNCFSPDLIAGQINDAVDTDEGLECPSGEFLVGIENGAAICEAEVWFTCPSGTVVTGFDSNGRVVCNVGPPLQCPAQTLTTSCNQTRTVTDNIFHGGTRYGYAFSGECHRIEDLDTAYLDSLTNIADVQAHVDSRNAALRTTEDCGAVSTDMQVRDTFECQSDGTWNTTPVNTLERMDINFGNWISNVTPLWSSGSSWWQAEMTDPAYDPANPQAVDPANNSRRHDCWCREDYVLEQTGCTGTGTTGNQFRIRKHVCPQTDHHDWVTVYPVSGGWDARFCGCAAGTRTDFQSCIAHFNNVEGTSYSGNGITGNVMHTYSVTCDADDNPVETLTSTDTSQCECPLRNSNYTTNSCPTGYVNSWTCSENGVSYTNIENVNKQTWSCPGGPAPQTISSTAGAGSFSAPTSVCSQSCVCNAGLTDEVTEACAPDEEGSGRTYENVWDCATNSWVRTPGYTEEDCNQCKWQEGNFSETADFAAPHQSGADCSSCSGTGRCFAPSTVSGYYDLYDDCYCAAQ